MRRAFLAGDASYDGVFWAGVRSTGIFCRPTCPARKPDPRQLRFFASPDDALRAGFRSCRRCNPLEPVDAPPRWLAPLLTAVDADPTRRWTERDLRAFGVTPERVRRWFQRTHGMTFQEYHRARRLGSALTGIQNGEPVSRAAFRVGYDSLSGFQEAFGATFGAAPTALSRVRVVHVERIPTPLGPLVAGASNEALHLLAFADDVTVVERHRRRIERDLGAVCVPAGPSRRGGSTVLGRVRSHVQACFEGAPSSSDVRLEPLGTPFQQDVWARVRAVPCGATTTYGALAEAVGRPGAARAVGAAVGANPIVLLIPCHRVVGRGGRLTGYAGGLWRKCRLLELERVAECAAPAASPRSHS